jgi:hypothetical protein
MPILGYAAYYLPFRLECTVGGSVPDPLARQKNLDRYELFE